jgi:hypothetical protein
MKNTVYDNVIRYGLPPEYYRVFKMSGLSLDEFVKHNALQLAHTYMEKEQFEKEVTKDITREITEEITKAIEDNFKF